MNHRFYQYLGKGKFLGEYNFIVFQLDKNSLGLEKWLEYNKSVVGFVKDIK